MLKKGVFLILSLLLVGMGFAQQTITQAEYFFDTDPGAGNGTSISLASPGDSINELLNIPTTGLSDGFHTLYLRLLNQDGNWSMPEGRTLLIQRDANVPIVSGEYFFNTDPGAGNGIPLPPFPSADPLVLDLSLPMPPLPPGTHTLFLRFMDQHGQWSTPEERMIFMAREFQLPIIAAEYFWNTDPGIGQGLPLNPQALGDTGLIEQFIPVPPLPLGDHFLHIRVQSLDGSWSLFESKQVNLCTEYGPVSQFVDEVYGNMVRFLNLSENAESQLWDFGNGKTDTAAQPVHFFDTPGTYLVRLISQNVCGLDTMEQEVVIGGIAAVKPNRGGKGGFVSGQVTGYIFQPDTFPDLRFIYAADTNIVLTPTDVGFYNDEALLFQLDLMSAPLGLYDVVYYVDGIEQMRLEEGFLVEPLVEPTFSIQFMGRRIVRPGVNSTMNIVIENNGNVDGMMVPISMSGISNLSGFAHLENPKEDISTYSVFEDSRNAWIAEGLDPALFDTYIFDIPFDDSTDYVGNQDLSFVLPILPPGQTVLQTTIREFKDTATCLRGRVGPAMINNDSTRSAKDCFATVLKCATDLLIEAAADFIGVGAIKDCVKAVGEGVIGVSNVTTVAAEAVTGGGKVKEAEISQAIKPVSLAATIGDVIINCGPVIINAVPVSKVPKAFLVAAKMMQKSKDAYDLFTKGVGAVEKLGCLYDIYKACGVDQQFGDAKFLTQGAQDPNAKYGPGVPGDNFVNAGMVMPYTITFENVDTASLPAQRVILTDTLNKDFFDLSTFTFQGYGFDSIDVVSIQKGMSFVDVLDLRPHRPNFLQIEGRLDSINGVLTWTFTTLDTTTLQLTDDVFAGFLPPNVNPPQGEGYVNFSVKLKPTLSHGSIIDNFASIIFDFNAPILTNTWENVYDILPPNSAVNPIPATVNDSFFTVSWAGSDDLAGIKEYDVYFSDNGGPFELWLFGVKDTQYTFYGRPGHSYGFYSVAVDRAENREDPPVGADAMTSVVVSLDDLPGEMGQPWLGQNYPNPAVGETKIPFFLPGSAKVEMKLFDAMGREVRTLAKGRFAAGEHEIQLSAEELPAGMYLYRLEVGEERLGQVMIIE